MKTTSITKKLFVAALLSVGAFGAFAASTSAFIRPPVHCICPDNYSPVLCPNGLTYGNACLAGCAGQHGCVPGDIF